MALLGRKPHGGRKEGCGMVIIPEIVKIAEMNGKVKHLAEKLEKSLVLLGLTLEMRTSLMIARNRAVIFTVTVGSLIMRDLWMISIIFIRREGIVKMIFTAPCISKLRFPENLLPFRSGGEGGKSMAKMRKKPEEIKKGLGCAVYSEVGCYLMKCPYRYGPCAPDSGAELKKDALSLIQQLEAENAELLEKIKQLERELDAAKRDMQLLVSEHYGPCEICYEAYCEDCDRNNSGFEWRGPCRENGGIVDE